MSQIKVYGADWCGDTRRTRRQLDSLGLVYDYIDIDADDAAEAFITAKNNGKRLTPTVDLKGNFLFEPTNAQLEATLREQGLIPSRSP
jgi:glutaredoxin